jgi:hypothetical protein
VGGSEWTCNEIASSFLENEEWISEVKKMIVSDGQDLNLVNNKMKEQADVLQRLLLQRLTSHVQRRCPNPKGSKWVFNFTAENLGRMAAMMCLQGHMKRDLTCLGEDKTLLVSSSIAFNSARRQMMKAREGCYLYYDTNDGIFIRSGKVSGRSFETRDKEHERAAGQGTDSLFYRRYPATVLTGQSHRGRKGSFGSLLQLVGWSYDALVVDERSIDFVIAFTREQIKRISDIKFGHAQNGTPLHVKKCHMTSYLAELAYDLSICTTDNMPTSPGYEACGLWER